ncbi:MAG: restriction endonuclease subunit S [Candidatus Eisenbacteria bacterium]|nr:restriction endonuclease subunit S [Candidatus Eisenbacteria bacterium]
MTTMIPNGWQATTVGEVFPTVGGGTPSTRVAEFWAGTVPWVTSADLREDGSIAPRKQITESAIAASATNLVPAGSVVVATRVGLGKVALAQVPLCFSQDCTALLTDGDDFHPEFVRLQMQRTAAAFRGRGTTINGITKKQLLDTGFLVAPLPEQRRIVEAIESYFTRLDDAVATLERVQRNLKRYRASVLKAAVEGRLVPTEAELARAEGRDYEPASALLKRILAERRRRWETSVRRGKYQEPVAPDPSGLPDLPEGWCWTTVDQLTDGARSCGYGVLVPGPDVPDGVPLVRVGDINDGQVAGDGLKRISRDVADQFERTFLRGGEVLITLVGTIGRTAVAGSALAGANVARAVGVIPSTHLVDARWIEHWLRSPRARAHMEGKAHEVARKTLNLEDVRAAPVALPPTAEQAQILARAATLASLVEAAASSVETCLLRSARLRQSILKWAFEGKLADQDPHDEPASVLLARIKAQRDAAETSTKKHGRPGRQARKTA